jgi:5-formyltetrahydrofolate cyclo-ligase
MMENWGDIQEWRRSMRSRLRSQRRALSRSEKESVRLAVTGLVREHFPELHKGCIGFYWPFQGEVDLRNLVRGLVALGAEAALPVVVEKRQPLAFWAWRPGMKLERGIWNIPVPHEKNPVRPAALLVPLLGFDAAGYRLGHGGGYYDRTLASLAERPLTIGVGYEFGRLKTIYPQAHDIPMDAVITERGVERLSLATTKLGSVE